MSCDNFPTSEDMQRLKANSDFETEFVESPAFTAQTPEGQTKLTISGIADKSGGQNKGNYLDDPILEDNVDYAYFVATQTKYKIASGVTAPYQVDSTTYPDPETDPNLTIWDLVSASSLPTLTDLVFDSVADMQTGKPGVAYSADMALKVQGENDKFTNYIVVNTSSDVDLGGGLWAKKLDVDSEAVDKNASDITDIQSEISDLQFRDIPAFDQIKNRMLTGRVDIIGIGDSNQLFGGYGFDNGTQQSFLRSFPMYATGLISGYENGSSGAGTGYGYSFNGAQSSSLFSPSGAPEGFNDYLDKGAGALNPHSYGYLESGTVAKTASNGMVLFGTSSAQSAIDTGKELTVEVHYGTFASGSGSFESAVRIDQSPFPQVVSSGLINTNTGTDGIAVVSYDVPADETRSDKPLRLAVTSSANGITAPFAYLWMRFIDKNQVNGFCYHTLDFRGGQSLRSLAYDIQQLSDIALGYYLEQARSKQTGPKMVVIYFNSGLNDRNEDEASIGPNPTLPGDSAEAYVDNATALIQRFEQVWELNGWDRRELYFLACPSHPVSNPDDSKLIGYRSALKAYMKTVTNAQFLDFTDFINADQIASNGWYNNSATDRNHLSEDGYNGMCDILFRNIK